MVNISFTKGEIKILRNAFIYNNTGKYKRIKEKLKEAEELLEKMEKSRLF